MTVTSVTNSFQPCREVSDTLLTAMSQLVSVRTQEPTVHGKRNQRSRSFGWKRRDLS
jgi:hypothetical protein